MMNEEQREYTITEMEEYAKVIKVLNKRTVISTIFMGAGALATVLLANLVTKDYKIEISMIQRVITAAVAFGNALGTIACFNYIIENLNIKAGLKVFNQQLQYNLNMNELANNENNDDFDKGGKSL